MRSVMDKIAESLEGASPSSRIGSASMSVSCLKTGFALFEFMSLSSPVENKENDNITAIIAAMLVIDKLFS